MFRMSQYQELAQSILRVKIMKVIQVLEILCQALSHRKVSIEKIEHAYRLLIIEFKIKKLFNSM